MITVLLLVAGLFVVGGAIYLVFASGQNKRAGMAGEAEVNKQVAHDTVATPRSTGSGND